MSKVRTIIIVGLFGVAGLSSAAAAHPKVTETSPAADAVVAASPIEIRLKFNEALEPGFSGAEIQNRAGQKMDTGKAVADPKDTKQLLIPLTTPLPAGIYTVVWHAVAADSHHVKGSYSFTVKQ